jgi:flagellar motor switch protein FliN/FliY
MSRTPIDLFLEALPAAASQALAKKTSATWTVTADDKPQPFPASTKLLTILVLTEPSKAEAAIQISVENALALASSLGGADAAAATPKQFQAEHAEAIRAILADACEKAAEVLPGTRLKLQLGKSVDWTPVSQISFNASDGASTKIQFQLLFTADWPKTVAGSQAVPSHLERAATPGVDVSLLENVQIEVTLQFGERRLPLREIGELRSGSVVELDKYIQDPAELLLGDRVIARGEVVVVDGNYGLRVTEVV